mgnify:CR=1 FL=1
MLCFDGNTLTVTVWALRAQTPTPTVRPWLGRVAGVSVRRMRTRWRAYTRFTCTTHEPNGDLSPEISAESEFFFELFPPAAGEKILQYTSKNGDLACSTVLHSTVKLRPK